MSERDFEQMYLEGDTPWDHGMHDSNLENVITAFGINPGKVLDIGCGTGSNSVWLAGKGFDVSGIDLSDTAIHQAQEKASEAGVSCAFQSGDFLTDHIAGAPFSLVVDRGCLHSIPEPADRHRFAVKVASMLDWQGYWFSLIGNSDEPPREVGPPQMSAQEIAACVEQAFEIVSLQSGVFGSDQENPPRAWICLMKKRN